MTENFSANAQAILMLTAPLVVGRRSKSAEWLSPGEYKRIAAHLHSMGKEPADLLNSEADQLIDSCAPIVDPARVRTLLARGFLLSQAMERWQAQAIWIVSRADPEYPQLLKRQLKGDAPSILYGCGDRGILDIGGLAVVGSRHVDDELIEYTEDVGRLVAASRRTLVSGGARGIDQAAMRGALKAGGRAIGVLADSLEKATRRRENREAILEGQLLLISPYDPSVGFNVGNAMQRNKIIYALADAALIVSAEIEKGGTWAGAYEQLKKYRFGPVYVRSTGTPSEGLAALKELGALLWTNPIDELELEDALKASVASVSPKSEQSTLGFEQSAAEREAEDNPIMSQAKPLQTEKGEESALDVAVSSDTLFQTVRELILRILSKPKSADDVAMALDVTKPQATKWLNRLVDEGVLEKSKRPVTYMRRPDDLFDTNQGSKP